MALVNRITVVGRHRRRSGNPRASLHDRNFHRVPARGPAGATVATVGIFLPAFFFVAVSGPLVPRIRRSDTAGAFLDGVNAASLALMVVVTYQLGRSALVDITTFALALTSALLLFRFEINSAWLVLGGAIAGWLLYGGVHP